MWKIRFIGSGKSTKDPVRIKGVKDNFSGITLEYTYLERKFGKRGEDWELERQALIEENGRYYDEMVLKFPDGTKKAIYFDVTPFLRKYEKGGDLMGEQNKPSYTEGWLKLQVSDIEKAFRIIQKHNVGAEISTKENTIEIDLDTFTVKELISLLKELEPICVPLEDLWHNLLNKLEEDEGNKSDDD